MTRSMDLKRGRARADEVVVACVCVYARSPQALPRIKLINKNKCYTHTYTHTQ